MLIAGEVWACESCDHGHRASICQHSDRVLRRIHKPDRLVSQYQHDDHTRNFPALPQIAPEFFISTTISKDNTEGECIRKTRLLAEFGSRMRDRTNQALTPTFPSDSSSQSIQSVADIPRNGQNFNISNSNPRTRPDYGSDISHTDIVQVMHKVDEQTRRGPWSQREDEILIDLVQQQGAVNWVNISHMLTPRTPKQCRERYHQSLKPTLNHGPITAAEGALIEAYVEQLGKRWTEIACRLGNHTDSTIQNWWYKTMYRRMPSKRPPGYPKFVDTTSSYPRTPASLQVRTFASY